MAAEWYYADGNEQKGPVTQEELSELARKGVLLPQSKVWKNGLPDWVQAHTIPEIFPAPPEGPGGPPPIVGTAGTKSPPPDFVKLLDIKFDRLVTLTIVKWLWMLWLGFVVILLAVWVLYALWELPILKALLTLIGVVLVYAFMTLTVRIWLEVICVVFRIAEDLRALRQKHTEAEPTQPA